VPPHTFRPPEKRDRLSEHSGFAEVVSQYFWLRVGDIWHVFLEGVRNAFMQASAPAFQEQGVGGILDQRAFESVLCRRRDAALENEAEQTSWRDASLRIGSGISATFARSSYDCGADLRQFLGGTETVEASHQ
jgi:hypothetical protein